MNVQPAALFQFDFFQPLPIHIQVSDAPLTSDAGLLPLRQFDQRIGLTKQFAAVLDDPRHPDLIKHSFTEMVRMRVFAILAGYQDQNDHDTLRTDAVFKLIADRSPTDPDLASQPTLSRFENQINIASLKRLRQVFVDQFIASFAQPPLSLTFDLDAVDDPAHGSPGSGGSGARCRLIDAASDLHSAGSSIRRALWHEPDPRSSCQEG